MDSYEEIILENARTLRITDNYRRENKNFVRLAGRF